MSSKFVEIDRTQFCKALEDRGFTPDQTLADEIAWIKYVDSHIENANTVFKDSCNHTAQAIDYLRSLLYSTPFSTTEKLTQALRPLSFTERYIKRPVAHGCSVLAKALNAAIKEQGK